jgi:hypothetical protein
MPGLTAARRIELLEYLRGNYEFWAKLHLGPAGPSCTANAATETTRQQVLVDAAAIVGNLVEIVSNTLVVWTNVQTPGQDAIETLTDLSIWPDNGSGAQRTVTNGVTNGTTTITSASAAFVSADIGATVTGSADLPGGVTIASVTNGTTAVLSAAATGSHTGQTFTITRVGAAAIGRMPLGGFPPLACSALASSNFVTTSAPGFTIDNMVEAFAEPGADPTLTGTGLSPDTRYFVVAQSGGTFKLSLTQGGSEVDILTDCNFRLQRAKRFPVISGGTARIPVGTFVIEL